MNHPWSSVMRQFTAVASRTMSGFLTPHNPRFRHSSEKNKKHQCNWENHAKRQCSDACKQATTSHHWAVNTQQQSSTNTMKLKLASLFIALCGCNNATAFMVHHHHHPPSSTAIAAMSRLHYKSQPEDDYHDDGDSPLQFSFDTTIKSNEDASTPSPPQPPPRRSFLHQLDRFLTVLQDTSSHLKSHTFLSGNFAPVSEEHVQVPVKVVEGRIPEGLDGAFCRNGPNPVIGQQRKRYHWVSRVDFIRFCRVQTETCMHWFIPSYLIHLHFSLSS